LTNAGRKMKIGLIQTRGIGDLIIALPIAQYFAERGHQVHWPIDPKFLGFMQRAYPRVNFIAVDTPDCRDGQGARDFFYNEPLQKIKALNCDPIFCLYSHMDGMKGPNERLAHSLKFDEYKYAVTKVPFSEKWKLKIERNKERELDLFRRLDIKGRYICVHSEGENFKANIDLPADWRKDFQIVPVSPITDSVFDWIYTFENAAKLVMIDSCFSNLVDQLNIECEKYLVLGKAAAQFTPVFRNGWIFR
jgi:hypothetical protein